MSQEKIFNGVKVNVTPLSGSDCNLVIGQEHGSMIDGKIFMRIYTQQGFDKVRKAFPTLGWRWETSRVTFHSDYAGQQPDVYNMLIA